MVKFLNAYHHKSPHAGEFSFNSHAILLANDRETADRAAVFEETVGPYTRRVGVWRIIPKE